ncbi:hypothetical protein [Kingella negevensis]|uniref:hypothetical protein n=1 Tax=Kingella negevensis TaxID=1522312 RepID=UPI00050A09DD|nr:hypothetical protein [Kingella negevensis]MDK4687688.1 hypothetical protein [Kingella negevensis]WII91316.1 hypothetical protein QEO93_01600 [Kingella negevensis]
MFNPDTQYRCDIIRGKAQKELDDLLPTYAAIVADICPADEIAFNQKFNDKLSQSFHQQNYNELDKNQQKTIRNHITEIAGKLFGLYFKKMAWFTKVRVIINWLLITTSLHFLRICA